MLLHIYQCYFYFYFLSIAFMYVVILVLNIESLLQEGSKRMDSVVVEQERVVKLGTMLSKGDAAREIWGKQTL